MARHFSQARKSKAIPRGNRGRKSSKPCCVVCGSNEAKYKCPKCREPYCRVACCKEHRSRCSALSASSKTGDSGERPDVVPSTKPSKYLPSDTLIEDPLQNAIRRRRMLEDDDESDEELEPGWRITRDMMDRLDGSSWLRKELADGGLRRMIADIDAADHLSTDENGRFNSRSRPRSERGLAQYELSPRELALERAKRDNPNFSLFIDRLLLTAGVLKKADSDALNMEQVLAGAGALGGLVLAPVAGRAKLSVGKDENRNQAAQSDDEDSSDITDDSTASSSDGSDESSSGSTDGSTSSDE